MNYTCKETCNMDKPCGNRHCSANSKIVEYENKFYRCVDSNYVSPKPKKEKK